MNYRLCLRPYRYPFRTPIQTFHGIWSHREGLLIGLQGEDEDDHIGWGEIAPIPWFGTETVAEAIAVCQSLPSSLSESDILAIPDQFPACQFGFGSAWESLHSSPTDSDFSALTFCGLLPAGEAACGAWPALWEKGYRTLKWKIGVFPLEVELQIFKKLIAMLPNGTKLRLDANGGLTFETARCWLEECDALLCDRNQHDRNQHNRNQQVEAEYLEQPLPPEQYEEMVQLGNLYRTSIALDESVATLQQLRQCNALGWSGVAVVKVAIAGYPHALRHFLRTHSVDVVFSSVFETEVGRNSALMLAQEFNRKNRAVGFGDQGFLI